MNVFIVKCKTLYLKERKKVWTQLWRREGGVREDLFHESLLALLGEIKPVFICLREGDARNTRQKTNSFEIVLYPLAGLNNFASK